MMRMSAYSAYDNYKDSGEGWIEDVPAHWETRKLKHLFQEKKHRQNLALNCGSISFGEVVEKDDERVPMATKASYQEVSKGEFLVNPLNLNYDLKSLRIGLSDIDVVVSAGYLVLQSKDEMNKRYFKYLLHRYDVAYMKLLGSGVRQTISFNHIANSILVAPPLPEQRAIAAFLDDKCAMIDEAVKIKEEQIALLRERRQIIIQDAVTHGLNAATPMKDSGIDWVGQIPAHWKLKKLKYVSSALRTGRTPPTNASTDHFVDGTVCWYTPGDFNEDGEFQGAEKLISPKVAEAGFLDIYPENSVYFVGIGGTLGRVNISRVKASCNQQFNVILPSKESAPELVLFWLMANRESIYCLTDFSTMPIRNQSQTKNIPIPCPPASEQEQIVGFVQDAIVETRRIISIKEHQIAALKEYKTSLIHAAVTGKIKVI